MTNAAPGLFLPTPNSVKACANAIFRAAGFSYRIPASHASAPLGLQAIRKTRNSSIMFQRPLLHLITRTSLVAQITAGLVAGILLALLLPQAADNVSILGELFVTALKAVAPVLVFFLVTSAIANQKQGQPTHIR